MKRSAGFLLLPLLMSLAGCGSSAPGTPASQGQPLTNCQDPRPEVCTFEYNPVCGMRDTGIRCVTTPCPSAEWKTYGNACSACSDDKVNGYRPGACENGG